MLRLSVALFFACSAVSILSAIPLGKSNIDPILGRDPELNPDLFEGDILGIDPNDKNAIRDETKLWPGAIIYYAVEGTLSQMEQDTLDLAVQQYREKTCIRLTPRTNERNYVIIRKTGGGCSSYVGMIGGAQQMSLDTSCYRNGEPGTVMHEFMHALGFHHEQSRTDRDEYVFVNYTNIQPGKEGNFRTYDQDTIQYLGADYDYKSILHYGKYGFAIDPTIPTITPIPDASVEIGQREGFSETDVFKLNALYKCNEK